MTIRFSPGRAAIVVALSFIAICALWPLVFMVISSVKTNADYVAHPFGLPQAITLKNFVAMLTRFDIARLFGNTIVYCVGAWILAMGASVPAAFAIAKLDFPLRRLFLSWIVVTLAVPGVAYLVPLYTMFARADLIDRPLGMMILWGGSAIPGNVFLLSAVMRGLPSELIEACQVDGAGYVRTMLSLVLPLSVPGIVTLTVFNVTGWWNDLLTPLIFLQTPERATVTLGVAQIVSSYSSDTPLFMTGLLFAALPVVVVYLVFQRHIRSGLVMGSVK
jgi:ABC-type glycerol-3-phosphate transport system permease component